MEKSHLNKAHHFYRVAEMEIKSNRYGPAIEAHGKAIECLELSLGDTTNSHASESLKLQIDWHKRQIRILEKRKRMQDRLEQMSKSTALKSNANPSSDEDADENKNPIQVAIIQTMKETDSLIRILIDKNSGGNSDSESLKSFSTTDTDEKLVSFDEMDNTNSNALTGIKHPKEESTILEELRILNGQLQLLVDRLVTQLNDSSKEVTLLKQQIKRLEFDYVKDGQNGDGNSLRVTTDSSGATSPYVFTPSSELSPDILPILAPANNTNTKLKSLTN